MYAKLFIRKKIEFKKLLAGLASRNYAGDEEMLEEISRGICEFAKADFTREELEKSFKEDRKGKINLNEILDCNKDEKDHSRLKVHLLATSDPNPAKVREGLRVLAKKLQDNDRALAGAQMITMTSWIVLEYPRLIEKAGFTILEASEIDKASDVRRSEMTREKFIELYGKK